LLFGEEFKVDGDALSAAASHHFSHPDYLSTNPMDINDRRSQDFHFWIFTAPSENQSPENILQFSAIFTCKKVDLNMSTCKSVGVSSKSVACERTIDCNTQLDIVSRIVGAAFCRLGVWGTIRMKAIKILISTMFCAAGLAALGAKADAAVVPVVDPYFDMFPTVATNFAGFQVGPGAPYPYLFFSLCGAGCAFADDNIVGWSATSTFHNPGVSGQWQTGVPQNTISFKTDPLIDGVTPEPIVARVGNAAISQVVTTTAVVGATYTLDVDLGFDEGQADNASVILVVNGHQVVATAAPSDGLTRTQMQNTGNWYDFEASYTATAADAGAPIEILLSSFTNGFGWGFFGNVRLTDSLPLSSPVATPEPATWAMLLIGFGGMAGVAVMRRRSFRKRSTAGRLA
jgi:hypothetical protein